MSSAPFLIWLLCIGVAALMIGAFVKMNVNKSKVEGFTTGIRITSCPLGSISYIDKDGNTNCCNIDVVDGKCSGTNMCSLSPSTTNIISCAEWLAKEWEKRARRFCPGSMRHYFGTLQRTPDSEGCSKSRCGDDGSAPLNPRAPKCKIYKSDELNLSNSDSCVNIRARDAMQCPQANATKDFTTFRASERTQRGQRLPALLKCTYIPSNNSSDNLPVTCYDTNRMSLFYKYIWDEQGYEENISRYRQYDFVRDVHFCPANKAYYIDKTLSRNDAWGLPGRPFSQTPPVCPPAPVCPVPKACPTTSAAKPAAAAAAIAAKPAAAAAAASNKIQEIAKAGISKIKNAFKRK